MAYGANYSVNPEIYSEVAAFSTRDNTIPSGASIVHGIYYKWDDEGFTGKGWMYEITGGPTNMYPDFQSNEDVANYVANNGDLNAVFSHWSTKYDLTGWDKFYNAVGIESGCMNVDKGE